jgi:hypothetical protein
MNKVMSNPECYICDKHVNTSGRFLKINDKQLQCNSCRTIFNVVVISKKENSVKKYVEDSFCL